MYTYVLYKRRYICTLNGLRFYIYTCIYNRINNLSLYVIVFYYLMLEQTNMVQINVPIQSDIIFSFMIVVLLKISIEQMIIEN